VNADDDVVPARSTTFASSTLADADAHVVVVGGGIARARRLAHRGGRDDAVPGVEIASRPAADLAQFVTGYREKGVEVLTGETVESVHGGVLTTARGTRSRATSSSRARNRPECGARRRCRFRSTTASSSTSTAVSTDATTSAAGDVANFPLLELGHTASSMRIRRHTR
jgi:hypothetical protein